jgi:hypothetical protein
MGAHLIAPAAAAEFFQKRFTSTTLTYFALHARRSATKVESVKPTEGVLIRADETA